MSKNTKRGLLALSLFLVLFPLATHKPGLPVTLKADEPAYYMMALSLAHDFDLVWTLDDNRRGLDEYPYLPARNFILMTDDNWETIYYGKPFIYSLMAAPLARFFGANGLVSFNMLLLVAMMWMGIRYLGRYNGDGVAALFTAGFFLVSHAFSYTFWLQPELFNMASGMLCLFLVFHRRDPDEPRRGPFKELRERLFHPAAMPAWAGAALALSIYNKPVMLALALPVVLGGPLRELLRRTLAFTAGAAIVFGLLAGFSILMTGHPSAYLGVTRVGVSASHPDEVPEVIAQWDERMAAVRSANAEAAAQGGETVEAGEEQKNSWWWIFRIPTEFHFGAFLDNVSYFLWGRHTGMFPYEVFGWLALLLFLLNTPRSGRRWWLIASLASVALFFIIWIPFNWHGGGGFIGNRYFVNVYPAFLFLVTRIRPLAAMHVAFALGGLYLGPMLLTPFGAPVPEPTLQAHTRGAPYRLLPLEFTVRSKVPGYRSGGHSEIGYLARKDVTLFDSESIWLQGASTVEIWFTSVEPLTSTIFEFVNFAPGNRIEVDFAGDRRVLDFDREPPHRRQESFTPRRSQIVRTWRGEPYHQYKMIVETSTGQPTRLRANQPEQMYAGAQLTYLGTPAIYEEDVFTVDWLKCELPTEVEAGEAFRVPVNFRNMSAAMWPHEGPLRVALSYHWLDEKGDVLVRDGRRTPLRRPLMPGKRMKDQQTVLAPEEPGRYILELDPLRERVGWFSERNPGVNDECRTTIEVLPATDEESSDEPAESAS